MELKSAPSGLIDLSRPEIAPQLKAQVDSFATVITLEPPQTVVGSSAKKTQQGQAKQQSLRSVFSSTFFTIFLAELGDKTQLSTLLMSAESQSPWVVFLGSAAALVTTSLLGVLLGQWLATRLTPKTLETAAGVSLMLVSAMLLWDVVQL